MKVSPLSAPAESQTEALPPVSLVICSRNRPQLLLETVASVLRGQEVPTEIVVVDQSARPHPALGELKNDRPCEVRYMWSPGAGVSRARNQGIASARHDMVAITDDDMLAEPLWLGALVRALVRAGPKAVVCGRVLTAELERSGSFALSTRGDETEVTYAGRIGKDVLYTGNMATYRSVLSEVGHFDERLGPGTSFPAAEDNDYGFRLLEAGYRILYEPSAILYHRPWRSPKEYLPARWRYGVGRGAYYAKHFRLEGRYMERRLLRDVRTEASLCLWRMRHDRRDASGHLLTALGIVYGALRWGLGRQESET